MSKPTLLEVVKSVIAAAIGVQSNANRQRDFSSGSLGVYVVAGIVATILFVGLVSFVVSMVL